MVQGLCGYEYHQNGRDPELDSIRLIKHDTESWNQGYIDKLSTALSNIELLILHPLGFGHKSAVKNALKKKDMLKLMALLAL